MNVLEVMLAEARAEVAVADHKASMVLTALGVGYGALLGGLLAGDWRPRVLTGWSEVVWWIGAAGAVAAVVAASLAVWPRWDASDAERGISYWGHVATFSAFAEFSDAIGNGPVNPDERVKHQLWHLSRIVQRKYSLVRIAFQGAWLSGALFLVSAVGS